MIPPTKRFDIVHPDWGMLRRSRRVLIFLYTLRRAALASRTITTYHTWYTAVVSKESWSQGHYVSTNHEPQLRTIIYYTAVCPMNDCNGKRESVTRTT